jgi:hypothetical protein
MPLSQDIGDPAGWDVTGAKPLIVLLQVSSTFRLSIRIEPGSVTNVLSAQRASEIAETGSGGP